MSTLQDTDAVAIRKSITLEQRISDTKGRSTGFDYMRITLATAVIVWHAFTVCYGNAWAYAVMSGPWRPVVSIILPMFFALSGFLVSGSLFRNPSISTFLGLRVIRIYPALTVEVLLSALLLGPLLTTASIPTYFTDKAFYLYLLNVTGHIHYRLPGVFEANPIQYTVNSQLWTVLWELMCYLSLAVLAIFRVVKNRIALTAVVLAASIADFGARYISQHGRFDQSHGLLGDPLLAGFLCAVTIYTWRDKLPWNGWMAAGCFTLMVVLLLVPGGDYLVGFPAAYATIYLGLLNPPKVGFLKSADYSYGLYLYGFVIQQALYQTLPFARVWWANLALSLIIGSAFAAFSWHVIEKPALRMKAILPHVEARLASLRGLNL